MRPAAYGRAAKANLRLKITFIRANGMAMFLDHFFPLQAASAALKGRALAITKARGNENRPCFKLVREKSQTRKEHGTKYFEEKDFTREPIIILLKVRPKAAETLTKIDGFHCRAPS